jgi:hypothetical protein
MLARGLWGLQSVRGRLHAAVQDRRRAGLYPKTKTRLSCLLPREAVPRTTHPLLGAPHRGYERGPSAWPLWSGRLPRWFQGAGDRAVASTEDLQGFRGSAACASRDVREGDQRLPCSRASLNSGCRKTGERRLCVPGLPGPTQGPVSSSTLPNITNRSASWQLRIKGENEPLFNLLVHRPVQMPDGCWRFGRTGCGKRVYHGRKKRPIATGMVRPPTNTFVSFGSCPGAKSSRVACT